MNIIKKMDTPPKKITADMYEFLLYKDKLRLAQTPKENLEFFKDHKSKDVYKFKHDINKLDEYIQIVNKWRIFRKQYQ